MFEVLLYLMLVIVVVILYFIFKPFVEMYFLKLQLGERAELMFHPFQGAYANFLNSQLQHNDMLTTYTQFCNKNPKVKFILSNLLHKPFIWVLDPNCLKEIYLEHDKYEKFDIIGNPRLLTHGLIMTHSNRWRRQRNLLGEHFIYDKLKTRIPMINDVVKKHILKRDIDNLYDLACQITGEVVIRSFFGESLSNLQLNGKPAQIEIVSLFNDLCVLQITNKYSFFKQLIFKGNAWTIFPSKIEKELSHRLDLLEELGYSIINQRIEQAQQKSQIEIKDFLGVYIEEYLKKNSKIGVIEIYQQFVTLFFAGTDTTATAVRTMLHFLGQYPEQQSELRKEVKEIIGERGVVLDTDLPKFIKMTAFINEVMRVKNPAFIPITREVKQDFQLRGIKLKKGWLINQAPHFNQFKDIYYKEPEKFNPNRWNQKNVINEDNGFIYTPFSAGPRNCIGQHMALMELKIILAHILINYDIVQKKDAKEIWTVKFLYTLVNDCVQLVKRQE